MEECHYAGYLKPKCRIVGYYKSQEDWHEARFGESGVKFSEIRAGVAFIHIKKDFDCVREGNMPEKLLSFVYDKPVGIGIYKKGDLTFVGFNFAYFQSLMLLKNGCGSKACFSNWSVGGAFDKADALKYDAADEIVEMEDLDLSKIDEYTAMSIYNAMDRMDNGGDRYAPILFQESYDEQKPLWDEIKASCKEIAGYLVA